MAGASACNLVEGVAESGQAVVADAVGDVADGFVAFGHFLDGHQDAVGPDVLVEGDVEFLSHVAA